MSIVTVAPEPKSLLNGLIDSMHGVPDTVLCGQPGSSPMNPRVPSGNVPGAALLPEAVGNVTFAPKQICSPSVLAPRMVLLSNLSAEPVMLNPYQVGSELK